MKKYILLNLLVALQLIASAWHSPRNHQQASAYGSTYAVVIGIADYKYDTSAPDLTWTINDADKFTAFLRSINGGKVPAENIYLLKDANAKKANILHYARQLFAKAKENDRVIFFFSGHGTPGALVPHDGVHNVKQNISYNLLYFKELQQVMKDAKCKTKMIFADACHSGSIKGDAKATTSYKENQKADEASKSIEVAIMTASSARELSIEMPDLKMGLFSYHLIKGLGGGADADKDSSVTMIELHNYVYRRVKAANPKQSPVTFGKFDKAMVVSVLK